MIQTSKTSTFFQRPSHMTFTPDLQTWPSHLTLTCAYLWFVPFLVDGLDAGHMIQTCCWSRLVPSGICVRATNTCHLLPYLICSRPSSSSSSSSASFLQSFLFTSITWTSVLSFPFQSILTKNLTFPKYLKINSTFLEPKKNLIRETFHFPQNKNVKKKKNHFIRSENVASVIMEEVALTAVLQPTTRRWRCSGFTLVELWCGRLCLWTSVVMVTVTVLDCPQLHSKICLLFLKHLIDS